MRRCIAIYLSLFVAGIAAAADYSWTGNGANVNWSTPGNWTNGSLGSYPQTSSDTATWTNNPGNRQPTLDVNVSLLSLTFASNVAWTVSGTMTATVTSTVIYSNSNATTWAPVLSGTCTVIVNQAGGSFALNNSNNTYSGQSIVLAGTLKTTENSSPTLGAFGSPSAGNDVIILGNTSGTNDATLSLGKSGGNFWRTIWSRLGSTGTNYLLQAEGNGGTVAMYAPVTIDKDLIYTDTRPNNATYTHWFPFQNGGATGMLNIAVGSSSISYKTNTSCSHLGGTLITGGSYLGIYPAMDVATSSVFTFGLAADGVNPGTITIDNGTFDIYTTINSGGGNLTCPNAFVITTNGGRFCGDPRSANITNVFTGPVTLQGKQTLQNAQNGSGSFIRYQGPVTIDQNTWGPHVLYLNQPNSTPKLEATISDGTGPAKNSLVLTSGILLPITNGAITHANGTLIEGDYGTVSSMIDYCPPNNAPLGTGPIWLADGARLRLYNAGNVAAGKTVQMMSCEAGMSTLVLSNNFVPTLTADSSGVLCADYSAFTAITNMALYGNGKMWLGTWLGGTFSGTALSPCSDGIYRLGAGGNANSLTISGANVLTGATCSVTVGAPGYNIGDYGNINLTGTNSYGGGSTVNEFCQLEGTAGTNGIPFGSTNGITLNSGILKLDGATPSLTNNVGALTINTFGSLIVNSTTPTNKLKIASVNARTASNPWVLYVCGNTVARLGGVDRIEVLNGMPSVVNGMLPPYFVAGNAAVGTCDYTTYSTTGDALGVPGFKSASAGYTAVASQANLTSCGANGIANITGSFAVTADSTVYAIRSATFTLSNDTVARTVTVGSGGVLLAGAGNTLTLGTMVNLAFGTAEAIFIGQGSSASMNIGANVTGSGGVTICGAGRSTSYSGTPNVSFTGTNLVTGTMSIIGGARATITTDAQLGAVTNIYLDNGAINDNAAGSTTLTNSRAILLGISGGLFGGTGNNRTMQLAGPVSGTGPMQVVSARVNAYGTNNTWSGGTWLQPIAFLATAANSTLGLGDLLAGGTAYLASDRSIGGGDFYGSNTTNLPARLSIMDLGAVYFYSTAPSIGSLSGSGFLYLTNNGTLTLGNDNSSTVYAGSVQQIAGTGAAITKTGSGTWTFKGRNGCSGVTTVNQGTFGADGYLAGGVTVNSGGAVTGSGSIGPLTVSSGGTVQPGTTSNAKVLSVGGAVTIASGGTYVANLNGNGTNDQILATGAITITGATLTPNLNYTSTVGDVWTILSSVGGITGTFNGLTDGTQISLAGGKFGRINYTAGTVTITAVSSSSAVDTSYLQLFLMR